MSVRWADGERLATRWYRLYSAWHETRAALAASRSIRRSPGDPTGSNPEGGGSTPPRRAVPAVASGASRRDGEARLGATDGAAGPSETTTAAVVLTLPACVCAEGRPWYSHRTGAGGSSLQVGGKRRTGAHNPGQPGAVPGPATQNSGVSTGASQAGVGGGTAGTGRSYAAVGPRRQVERPARECDLALRRAS